MDGESVATGLEIGQVLILDVQQMACDQLAVSMISSRLNPIYSGIGNLKILARMLHQAESGYGN